MSMNIASTSSSSIPLNDSAASSNGSSSDDDDDVDEVDDEGIGESLVSISTTDCLNKKKCIRVSVKINDQSITVVIQ